jgi:hypothetical protein
MDRDKTVSVTTRSSIGIGTITFAVLLVMKILGKIEMDWFWVITSFIWVPLGLTVGFLLLFLIIFLLSQGVLLLIEGVSNFFYFVRGKFTKK